MILYSLTPRSTVLQKLTVSQLVKKFATFYGTRRFITAFTSARHLSLFWVSSIQSIPPHPTSWRSILMLFSHLRLGLPSALFPSGFLTNTLYRPLPFPISATSPAHFILGFMQLENLVRGFTVIFYLTSPPVTAQGTKFDFCYWEVKKSYYHSKYARLHSNFFSFKDYFPNMHVCIQFFFQRLLSKYACLHPNFFFLSKTTFQNMNVCIQILFYFQRLHSKYECLHPNFVSLSKTTFLIWMSASKFFSPFQNYIPKYASLHSNFVSLSKTTFLI